MTKNRKIEKLLIIGIASMVIFAGCSAGKISTQSASSKTESSSMRNDLYLPAPAAEAEEKGYSYDEAEPYAISGSTDESIEIREEKIVKTGDLNLSVGDFDSTVESLYSITENAGGYVEGYDQYLNVYSTRESRSASATLKIPAGKFDEVKSLLSNFGTVKGYSEHIDNITNRYYDTESRLDMKIIERDRLLELLEQAESIEDLIAVEARLSQVKGDIDILESYMTSMDRNVDYSTLYVYVEENPNESIQPVGQNLGSRIVDSFKASINFIILAAEKILLFIVFISAPLFITLTVIGTGMIVFKKAKKKK